MIGPNKLELMTTCTLYTRWSQMEDQGTSHFCIVDEDRNAVSMTTTVNYPFGCKVLSPATGIVLNNEMGDFSVPTEISSDSLPPSPTNFIEPNKRPISCMTPIVVLKVKTQHQIWNFSPKKFYFCKFGPCSQ